VDGVTERTANSNDDWLQNLPDPAEPSNGDHQGV